MIKRKIKEYAALVKVSLVFGNLITAVAGFALASRAEKGSVGLFVAMLVGIFLVMASGCAFNNYIDRDIDGLMDRTKDRALVKGRLSKKEALSVASVVGLAGFATLLLWTNLLTTLAAALGFFFYVGMYTMWSKRQSVYGTFVGALSGAMPPVVGYCAVSNRFDAGALLLFLIMLVWQMPHFFAIAIRREHDYAAAGIPVMPVKHGIYRTKVSMLIYIVEFTLAASLLTIFGYSGYVYLTIAVSLGVLWFLLGLRGFTIADPAENKQWARQMFLLSLIVMMVLFITIALGF